MDLEPSLHEHAAYLRALARRLAADSHEAEDLVQDACVRALSAPAIEVHSPRSWLAAIVRNVFRDQRAAAKAREAREQQCARQRFGDTGAVGSGVDDPAGVDLLARAVQALPQAYRHVLQLRYYAQRSTAEIAAELGVPVATIKTRLQRALDLLRADLVDRAGGAQRLQRALLPLLAAPATASAGKAIPIVFGVIVMKKHMLAVVALVALAVSWCGVRWTADEVSRPDLAPSGASRATGSLANGQPTLVIPDPVDRAADERATAAPATAVLRGVVVYPSTRQGVPFLPLSVRDTRGREDLLTALDGSFATTRAFDAGAELTAEGLAPLHADTGGQERLPFDGDYSKLPEGATVVRRVDTGEMFVELERAPPDLTAAPPRPVEVWRPVRDFGDGATTIPVHVGPTYFVDTTLPEGVGIDDVAVALGKVSDTATWAHRWSATSAPLQARNDCDGQFWCRPASAARVDPATATLFVGTRDGLWSSSGRVRETRGVQMEPVAIVFARCGVVTGVVRDRDGRACTGMWVNALPIGADTRREVYGEVDAQGLYRIPHVAPGTIRLQVLGERTEPWQQAIEVLPGRELRQDIVLNTRPSGGAICGTITTDSGAPFAGCCVILTSRHDASLWRTTGSLEWAEVAGRQQATWSFDDVPQIECEVSLHTFAACGLANHRHRITPPAGTIAFRIHDQLPQQRVKFAVHGHGTGEVAGGDGREAGDREPGDWSVFLNGDSGWELRLDHRAGTEAPEIELPVGEPFTWRLTGASLRAQHGRATPAAGTPLAIPIATGPGFSTKLACMDINNFHGARGVEVFADGAPIGRTDAAGELWIDLRQRPRALTLDPTGWRIVHSPPYLSDVDAETGAISYRGEGARLHVYVKPLL